MFSGNQGTTNTTATTGHTGPFAKIKNALDPNVHDSSLGATTDAGYGNTGAAHGTGTTGTGNHHHHFGRDAAVAGGVGGAVGLAEHEHHRHQANAAHNNAGYGAGAGTTETGYGNGAGTNGAGYGAGAGAGAGVGSNTNPSNAHAGGSTFKGRLQEAAGALTGNRELQAKGAAQQQAAQAEKFQRGEINEAERLESTAQMRRDRAVASGANPLHGSAGGTGGNY